MQPTSVLAVIRANARCAGVIAAVVGTALVLIDHGGHLGTEPSCRYFALEVGARYAVPFAVSVVSAVLASRD